MARDRPVALRLDGRDITLSGVPPTMTLLTAVRAAGLVGTKEGCGDGDCGACTVVVASTGPDGTLTYQAVNSCLVPVGSVDGRDVVTVAGVASADGGLHPVQQAMVDCAGSQCGYCTPGFVMSMVAGYHDPAHRGPDGLDDAVVEGNLCRCTGYASIRRACARLGGTAAPLAVGAAVPPPESRTAVVDGRAFHRPTTLAQAVDLLADEPQAQLLAGGTDVGLELSHHRIDPAVTISLEDVEDLQRLEVDASHVRIGGGVTLTRLERATAVATDLPAMAEMLRWFAARQIRNRATVGGNLATASPIGDLPPVLLALDAELLLTSRTGSRSVAVADFFTGYRTTVRRSDEVIARIDVPRGPAHAGTRRLSQAYKVGKRGTDDISIVAAAFTVDLDEDDRVVHARLAYGGVAATPARAIEAELLLLGEVVDPGVVARVVDQLRSTFTPLDDLRGSAAYRTRLVTGLFEKFVHEHVPAGERALA